MTALLALIPSRAYLYGAIVIVLALAFGGYTIHERNVEHAKDVAAASKIVAKDNAAVAADDAHAQTTETQIALIYKQAVSIPAVADIGLVCQRPARSVPLPAAGAVATAPTGNGQADSGSGHAEGTYDPSGYILTRSHEADAQIIYLQGRIAELEKQMNDAP
jgi:hypothetical protein